MIKKNFYEACKDIFKNNTMYRQYITSLGSPFFGDTYIKKDVDWIVFYENHQESPGYSITETDINESWVKVKLTKKKIKEW